MSVPRLTKLSLLTAVSLIIFIIELRIPNLVPVPGVKLGLANIVTVYAVYSYTAKETFLMVVTRILLGAFFSSNPFSLVYSFAGACFCLTGMLLLRKIIPQKYIWLSSIFGAVFHNTGQILMAVLVMQTVGVFGYYPILLFSGCIAGLFTGICAQMLVKRKLPQSQDDRGNF